MISVEEYYESLKSKLEEISDFQDSSRTEISRKQAKRIAHTFSLQIPKFRTEIHLRMSPVHGQINDVDAENGSKLIGLFSDLIKICAQKVPTIRNDIELYFSPFINQGSTIFTLFGEIQARSEAQLPLANFEELSDLDLAINKLSLTVDELLLNGSSGTNASHNIDGEIGKKLFAVSKQIVDGDHDLELIWVSLSGRRFTKDFSQEKSSKIKSFLDFPIIETRQYRERVHIESISSNGSFMARKVDGPRKSFNLIAPEERLEELREFWLKNVDLELIENRTSYPQRQVTDTKFEFIDFRIAPDQGLLF